MVPGNGGYSGVPECPAAYQISEQRHPDSRGEIQNSSVTRCAGMTLVGHSTEPWLFGLPEPAVATASGWESERVCGRQHHRFRMPVENPVAPEPDAAGGRVVCDPFELVPKRSSRQSASGQQSSAPGYH